MTRIVGKDPINTMHQVFADVEGFFSGHGEFRRGTGERHNFPEIGLEGASERIVKPRCFDQVEEYPALGAAVSIFLYRKTLRESDHRD